MLPADVYRSTSVADQPHGPHFPTAFTEHFPPVHAAKYELGQRIVTATNVVALHANLPKYGLAWHKEPMKGIWDDWLLPNHHTSLDKEFKLDTNCQQSRADAVTGSSETEAGP